MSNKTITSVMGVLAAALLLMFGWILGDAMRTAQMQELQHRPPASLHKVDFVLGDFSIDLRDISPKFTLRDHTIMCQDRSGHIYFGMQSGMLAIILSYNNPAGNGFIFRDTEGKLHTYLPFMPGHDPCVDIGRHIDA